MPARVGEEWGERDEGGRRARGKTRAGATHCSKGSRAAALDKRTAGGVLVGDGGEHRASLNVRQRPLVVAAGAKHVRPGGVDAEASDAALVDLSGAWRWRWCEPDSKQTIQQASFFWGGPLTKKHTRRLLQALVL